MPHKYKLTEATNLAKDIDAKIGDFHYSSDGDTKFTVTAVDDATGAVSWDILNLPSFEQLFKTLDKAISSSKGVYTKVKQDTKFRDIYDEIRKVRNSYRTHLRNEYPDEYDRIKRKGLTELNIPALKKEESTSGAAGPYNTPYAFVRKPLKPKSKNKKSKSKYRMKMPSGLVNYMDYSVNEGHGLDKGDVDFLQSLVDRMQRGKTWKAEEFTPLKRILKFIIKSNILQDKTRDLSKDKVNERRDLTDAHYDYVKDIIDILKSGEIPQGKEWSKYAIKALTDILKKHGSEWNYYKNVGELKEWDIYNKMDWEDDKDEKEARLKNTDRKKIYKDIDEEKDPDSEAERKRDEKHDKLMKKIRRGDALGLGPKRLGENEDRDLLETSWDYKDELGDIEKRMSNLYREMENDPEVEPEGGPVANQYGDELNKLERRQYALKRWLKWHDTDGGVDNPAPSMMVTFQEGTCGFNIDAKTGKKLNTPGGLKSKLKYKLKESAAKSAAPGTKNPGATLGPGPAAGPDGVADNAYIKQFKFQLVPKNKDGTYVQKGSGMIVKKLF